MDPEQELKFVPPDTVWIGSEHPFDLHEAYLCFRSPATRQLAKRPEKVDLFITADSRYKLWINGRFAARGPARCFPEFQAVDRLDITAYLSYPAYRLAVQVYQPGYSHFSYVHRGVAGLLAWVVIDGEVVLETNTAWRVRRDDSFSPLVPRVSIYGSGVEDRDLGQADNWLDESYDDSDWSPARVVAPAGGWPWTSLRPRGLPLLEERNIPAKLLETRLGNAPKANQPDHHLAVWDGWAQANPSTIEADENGAFYPNLAKGEAAYWLFDLGRDYTCQGWAEIDGAGGREHLSISYAETMRNGQLVMPDPQTYCRVRLTDHFRLRQGTQVVETLALRGGRYLVWQLAGPNGKDFRFRPCVRVTEYPLQVTRPLKTSDKLLNQIIQLCETTIQACLQDGFIDCVWRENTQWLGDALPQGLTLWSMMDDPRPIRQVLLMAAQGAYPDGILPSVLPGEVHAYTIVRYNFMWAELLAFYHQVTVDDALIKQLWPALQKMLDAVHHWRTRDEFVVNPPGRRFFVDWSPISQNEPHAVYNLHYVLALQKAGSLAEEVGLMADARRWRDRARDLCALIRGAFYREGCWFDDLGQTTHSQLAAAFAILTNATQPEEKDFLLDAIANRSLDAGDGYVPGHMVLASPFMHHYIFEALWQEGRFEQLVQIIRLRWGRWVKAGYPTTWENWNVDFPDGSQCHSFSAHPRYHLAKIGREQGWLL